MHYVNVPCRIKSAFRRSRLTDIPLLSFYHSTRWNPLASPRIEGTHQSATRQCEILKTIDKKGDAKIDLTFPWTITEVELSVASNLSLHLHHFFFAKMLLHHINIYLHCELSFLMQIIHWRKYSTQGLLAKSSTTVNCGDSIILVIAL